MSGVSGRLADTKAFTPQTTMFSRQEVTCPKCGIRATAYYNDDKIVDLQQKTSD